MLIESGSPIALFLFAHQDDEFGVFAQIEQELKVGRRVCCIYATDGAATADPEIRNAESLTVLGKLGVFKRDIFFIGQYLSIGDGKLHQHTQKFSDWLNGFFTSHLAIETCFVPAWEGGHPDHDLVHAITVESLWAMGHLASIWQYPLYNGRKCIGPFFRLLSPLPENGLVKLLVIGWYERFRYLRLCLSYSSQWRTWIGLFPFLILHYFLSGVQQLQKVNRARILQPPHSRPLYYERRKFLDWPTVESALKDLSKRRGVK